MGNTYEIVTRIMEAYHDKEKENDELLNKKQSEIERINTEFANLRQEKTGRIKTLIVRLKRLEEEEKEPYFPEYYSAKYDSNPLNQIDYLEISKPTIRKDDGEFYSPEELEQKYQSRLSELNSKLNEKEKKMIEREKLVNELIHLRTNKDQLRREYVKQNVNISDEETAYREGIKYNKIHDEKEAKLVSKIAIITSEINNAEEIEREKLINELAYLQMNKEQLKEEFVKQQTNDEETAKVVRANYDRKHEIDVNKLIEAIVAINDKLDKKKQNEFENESKIKSEIEQIKLERYKTFGRSTPAPDLARKRYLDEKANQHKEQLNAELKSEYDKNKSQIIKEIKEIAAQIDTDKEQLKNRLELASKIPDFSQVYLREMFDLKFELSRILLTQKIMIESRLNDINNTKNGIINPILSELHEKEMERKGIVDRIEHLRSKVDIEKYEIPTDEIYQNLKADMKKLTQEIINLETQRSKALSETKPMDKEINALNKAIELINRSIKLLSVLPEEHDAYMYSTTSFTEEEQKEYDRRQNSQRVRINNILNLLNKANPTNLPITNPDLGNNKKR